MLKWLVTKSPNQISLENSVTDDPLATLSRRGYKHQPLYAVSRVNPIFDEEDGKGMNEKLNEVSEAEDIQTKLPDSPPTDRESVRSSGYGSKDADSVSYKSDAQEDEEHLSKEAVPSKEQEDDHLYKISEDMDENHSYDSSSVRTVADIRRSFESLSDAVSLESSSNSNESNSLKITTNPEFVENIELGQSKFSLLEAIPEIISESENESSPQKKSSWPRVTHLAQALQKQADRIHQRRERERLKQTLSRKNSNNNKAQVLRFHPLVSVVAQDRKYVTAISLSPHKNTHKETETTNTSQNFQLNSKYSNENNFQLGMPANPISSHMQNNGFNVNAEFALLSLQPDSLITEDTLKMMNHPEYDISRRLHDTNVEEGVSQTDLPNFGRAIYSNFYSTNNSSRTTSQESLSRKERTLTNNSAKIRGVNVVKDLWEKSGLKTNGRKLLVSVNDAVSDDKTLVQSGESFDAKKSSNVRSKTELMHYKPKSGIVRTVSRDSEKSYENISNYPHTSSNPQSSVYHSYEDISENEKGIDNLGFVNDRGNSINSISSSIQSKHGYQFQHNYTDFQKRVSERLQGEPYHPDNDLEQDYGRSGKEAVERRKENRYNSDRVTPNINSKNYPGKAVRSLGLEDNLKRSDWRGYVDEYSHRTSGSPWTVSQNYNETGHPSGSLGQRNRMQIWEQFYGGRYKDETFPGYFFRHPNSEAPIFAHREGLFHDFTMDAKRSHRIMQKSTRSKRRRRCCLGLVILLAFLVFVGAIVGMSWFSTGGERLFGAM